MGYTACLYNCLQLTIVWRRPCLGQPSTQNGTNISLLSIARAMHSVVNSMPTRADVLYCRVFPWQCLCRNWSLVQGCVIDSSVNGRPICLARTSCDNEGKASD